MKASPKLSIIAPLYNEEEVFDELVKRLIPLLDRFGDDLEIVFIDDGSKDATPELMRAQSMKDGRYHSIFLSRNFGHQIAVSAGMAFARAAEGVMIIDGDLQDPPELLDEWYRLYKEEGYDVIYGVRTKRKENPLKKSGYFIFYRILKHISYMDIAKDSGDFAFMSRRVVDQINRMPEESRFIRGMRSWVGFKQKAFEYERNARFAGEAKYSYKELFKLAYNGIFNFSDYPVKFITRLGMFSIIGAFLYIIYAIFDKYYFGNAPQGFAATIIILTLFAGVQLIALGVLGEYILRIFFQVKGRPRFVIARRIADKNYISTQADFSNNHE